MTKSDPLKEFRNTARSNIYAAYGLSSEPQRHLEIRLKSFAPCEAPGYAFLSNIVGEWRYGQMIVLTYTLPMQVEILGENLTDLLRALQKGNVQWIQEFDADEWGKPPENSTEPIITSIKVKTTQSDETSPVKTLH